MLEQLLEQLTEELGVKPLKADEKGGFHLILNPDRTIELQPFERGMILSTEIAPCPDVQQEVLLILLMKANLLGQGTGGAAIGLDKEEKFLTLSRAIPYEMNYKGFRETLEDFANYADYWKKVVIDHVNTQKASL